MSRGSPPDPDDSTDPGRATPRDADEKTRSMGLEGFGSDDPSIVTDPAGSAYGRHDGPASEGLSTERGSFSSAPTESFPERASVAIEPGRIVFGKYEVLERLGGGGMGEVWLVRDIELDVKRAMKTITQSGAFHPEARARFQREARAMARFSHPNVVSIHDSRLLDRADIAYIVMEYVPGRSLEKVVGHGQAMPLAWVDHVLGQLCDALAEAHAQGIIHRDLKPSNLILVDTPSKQDVLKVLDFGIAKILQAGEVEHEAMTVQGTFMGTPPYASPEQAVGMAVPSSDLYSTGVILYEFLTGSRPFVGRLAELVAGTLYSAPPAFSEVNPDQEVPPAVEAVVMRCLAKKPAERPQSAQELIAEFRAALAGTAPSDDRTAVLPEPKSDLGWSDSAVGGGTAGKRRSPALIASVVATLVPLVGAGVWMASRKAPSPPVDPSHAEGAMLKVDPRDKGGGTALAPVKAKGTREPQIVRNDRTYDLKDGHYLPVGYEPVDTGKLADDRWPAELERKGDRVRFVRIVGGKFRMGAVDRSGDAEPDGDDSNRPAREVVVPGFYLQKYEVTNAELAAYVDKAGDKFTPPEATDTWKTWFDRLAESSNVAAAGRHPARQVPWRLAAAFAKAHGGRLPTEAEWEFAARSGQSDRPFVWDAVKDRDKGGEGLANLLNDNFRASTAEVGSYPADQTLAGVMDLAGNVREWTRDPWVPFAQFAETGAPGGPDEPGLDAQMAVRGGSFARDLASRFITRRGNQGLSISEIPIQDVGFRMVLECPE